MSHPRLHACGTTLAYGYAGLLVVLFASIAAWVPLADWWRIGTQVRLLEAVAVTLATSLVSTAIALAVALPIAWRMAAAPLRGKAVLDVIFDLPMSVSPLVLGMGFLLFFASPPGRMIEDVLAACGLPLRGSAIGVVVAQTVIAIAFAVRTLRAAVDPIVADGQALGQVWRSPTTRRPLVAAITITWARTVGEFGPMLLFVGIVPGRSEVLSTSVYLSWQSGDLTMAAMAATVMIGISFAVVLVVRHAMRPAPTARQ